MSAPVVVALVKRSRQHPLAGGLMIEGKNQRWSSPTAEVRRSVCWNLRGERG